MPSPPASVTVVEVGPRDGLQGEPHILATRHKLALIERLADAGLPVVEATACVRPDRIPQLADAEAVLTDLRRRPGTRYPVLVPNPRGLERALSAGARELAVFTAASETFSRCNVGCSVAESLERLGPVIETGRARGMPVRAYLSCALGCPYEGRVPSGRVAGLAEALFDMGAEQVALSDTAGLSNAREVSDLVALVAERVPVGALAVHLHDTRGQALGGVLTAVELGVTTVDASVAGLGGCPYAPGAGGNLATEDLVYMLEGSGIHTGIDLPALIETGRWVSGLLDRPNQSRVARTGLPEGRP